MKLYEVGGHIRDGIMGIKSNDVDYSVEMECLSVDAKTAYETMNGRLKHKGFEIFVKTPGCFTTRAMFPKDHEHEGVADFVMCRKETYTPGSRTPQVEVGTLMDDLRRRDFTVNAIARDIITGEIIDPFNGREAIEKMMLICPNGAVTSFNDDPLRILRALRFFTS